MTNPLVALYRLLLRQQLSRGRLLLAAVVSALVIVVGILSAGNSFDRAGDTVFFVSFFGHGLIVPILALVLASAALGQLVEDETLVYLWTRPNPRWMLAAAAWAASLTVALPLSVIPLTVSAAISSGNDGTIVSATALSAALATIGYTGIFTLLGLVLRRALIWGLIYVFIWEFFIARAGQGAARLSINTYPSSVLAEMTNQEILLAERSMTNGIMVPITVAVVFVALTAWRLERTNVA